MPLPARPTRTSATEAAYRRRTRELVARCRKMLRLHPNEELDHRQFVGWLITRKPDWARSTWRQYKASVAYILEQEVLRTGNPRAKEALDALMPVDVTGCTTKTKRTSGSKLKRFPIREYRALVEYLRTHPGQWHKDLERWIAAGLLTGLRPQEWSQAKLGKKGGEVALIVTNAKATNQRAHGPTRTILLGGLSDDEREIIAKHLARATEWHQVGQFRSFYQGCAATLSRASRQLWPQRAQHPTLYSARHQFSADAKASGMLREEIAALMGHAVDTTATRHYGRKTAGLDMIRVRPDPAEVARVRSVFIPRTEPKPKPAMEARLEPRER